MKPRLYLLVILMILAVLVIAFVASNSQSVIAANRPIPPTPAPTATPGPPPPNPTTVPLAQPLATEEQALEQILYHDAILAVWAEPWSKDTLRSQPDRITIKAYPSRAAESAASGWNEWFAPEIEADAGSVWAITIKGKVQVTGIPTRVGGAYVTYPNGVTYVISQRTGRLLTIRSLQP